VLELDFPLLSDWTGEAIRDFGVEHEVGGLAGVAERSAFLLDTGGVVRGSWRYEDDQVPDVDELLAAARALAR
jgi:peroxiredoxin